MFVQIGYFKINYCGNSSTVVVKNKFSTHNRIYYYQITKKAVFNERSGVTITTADSRNQVILTPYAKHPNNEQSLIFKYLAPSCRNSTKIGWKHTKGTYLIYLNHCWTF